MSGIVALVLVLHSQALCQRVESLLFLNLCLSSIKRGGWIKGSLFPPHWPFSLLNHSDFVSTFCFISPKIHSHCVIFTELLLFVIFVAECEFSL